MWFYCLYLKMGQLVAFQQLAQTVAWDLFSAPLRG